MPLSDFFFALGWDPGTLAKPFLSSAVLLATINIANLVFYLHLDILYNDSDIAVFPCLAF